MESSKPQISRIQQSDRLHSILTAGNNVLLSGPRRMGKTHFLRDYIENYLNKNRSYGIYVDVQGIYSEREFYQRINRHVIDRTSTIKSASNAFSRRIAGLKRADQRGDEFSSYVETVDLLKRTFSDVPHTKSALVVIVLDEFSIAVRDAIKSRSKRESISLLQSNRVMRQELRDTCIRFVYSGSVEIYNIVRSNSAAHLVNDLRVFRLEGLSLEEASRHIFSRLKKANLEISENASLFLAKRLGTISPFILNLMIEKVESVAKKSGETVVGSDTVLAAESELADDSSLPYILNVEKFRYNYNDEADELRAEKILDKLAAVEDGTQLSICELMEGTDEPSRFSDILRPLLDDGLIKANPDAEGYAFDSKLYKEIWRARQRGLWIEMNGGPDFG